jgi:hypothetical protein
MKDHIKGCESTAIVIWDLRDGVRDITTLHPSTHIVLQKVK